MLMRTSMRLWLLIGLGVAAVICSGSLDVANSVDATSIQEHDAPTASGSAGPEAIGFDRFSTSRQAGFRLGHGRRLQETLPPAASLSRLLAFFVDRKSPKFRPELENSPFSPVSVLQPNSRRGPPPFSA
jgi:hypothetical protein